MSSHHIVKEDQEPALIVTSMSDFSAEYLGQLLEWSPTLICTQEIAEQFVREGVKVDMVFAKDDYVFSQEQTKVLPIETSFLGDSLNYLLAHRYKAVNIICDALDPEIMDFVDKLNIVLFAEGKRYVFVQGRYEKWKPANEKIYVDETLLLNYSGLEKCGSNVFVTQKDGFFNLEGPSAQHFCIGEDL